MDFRPISLQDLDLDRYSSLFKACFPPSPKFSRSGLDWLYRKSPFGQPVGFDAWEGDRLAAHYVCVPGEVRFDGAIHRMLLSLNTATHPDFQGRGLFTRLAEQTYERAADLGFSAVFGVANSNSTPGFVRKLGFDLIEPLQAKIGIGPLGLDFDRISQVATFERLWSTASLDWRCSNPANPVMWRSGQSITRYYAATSGYWLPAYAEHPRRGGAGEASPVQRWLSPLRLYLGLFPAGSDLSAGYVDIPSRLRPSPLNFIFKPLRSGIAPLLKGQINFSFLDFDAY